MRTNFHVESFRKFHHISLLISFHYKLETIQLSKIAAIYTILVLKKINILSVIS